MKSRAVIFQNYLNKMIIFFSQYIVILLNNIGFFFDPKHFLLYNYENFYMRRYIYK